MKRSELGARNRSVQEVERFVQKYCIIFMAFFLKFGGEDYEETSSTRDGDSLIPRSIYGFNTNCLRH